MTPTGMTPPHTLDPADWDALRVQGHRMLDDILDYLEHIRSRPVWQPIPAEERACFREPLPLQPTPLEEAHEVFLRHILPFAVGNAHPGFMGWVHGAGTPVGLLAEMLAGGLDANLGGRDQMPVEVERQVVAWVREMLGFPPTASGVFVTGSSAANLVAVLVARYAALGHGVRRKGLASSGRRPAAYASTAVHNCIPRAMDIAGFGTDALRLIPVDEGCRMDTAALRRAIDADRESGCTPFLVVATAGTVDTGAIDDLAAIAGIAEESGLWLHVDGAFGALALLAPDLAPRLEGIERAHSVALDFHKWGHVPYDAGMVVVRDGELHRAALATSAGYLRREARGMAAGSPWPCDLGPDLSRGFRALKTWFTLKVYGTQAIGRAISGTCALARYMAERVEASPALELLAPVSLNIVCYRYQCPDPDRANAEIVVALQESGIAAPSSTVLDGRLAIRAAIVNHRTTTADVDALLDATIRFGDALHAAGATPGAP